MYIVWLWHIGRLFEWATVWPTNSVLVFKGNAHRLSVWLEYIAEKQVAVKGVGLALGEARETHLD